MFDFESMAQASSVAHAIHLLQEDPEAIVIAGGSDVLIQIREGRLAHCRLVSIHGLAELEGIHLEADGTVLIRPLSTFAQVTESPVTKAHVPTLGYATNQAGGPQLRNTGTIGGNVCNGVTSADSAATLLTLNAQLEITGPAGVRYTPLETFYTGPGRVALQHAELLTGIRIAKEDYDGFSGCYIKFAQRAAMDIATLGTALHVRLNEDKRSIAALRLAFGVAGPTPMRCPAAEAAAEGQAVSPTLLETVARTALAEVNPRTSWRASKEFRQQLVYENTKRALAAAIQTAGGERL